MKQGINAAELLKSNLKPPTMWMTPWLTESSMTMIHAWRGMGKTWLSMCLAYALAKGRGTFLNWKTFEPRRVLYIDGEMGTRAILGRLKTILNSDVDENDADIDDDALNFFSFEHCGGVIWNLADLNDQHKYTQLCANYNVIIIDNISTCVRYKNANDEMTAWADVHKWSIKRREEGKAIIFIHHQGKSGQQRGVSSKEDPLDTVINLKRSADYSPEDGARFELHFEKARHFYGPDAAPQHVALISGEDRIQWVFTPLKEYRLRQVQNLSVDGMKPQEIAMSLGIPVSDVNRLLTKKTYGMAWD
jgi:putative DNA primase/helicase